MTLEPLRPDYDDDDRRFLKDVGLPPGDAPWQACPPVDVLLAADEGTLPEPGQDRVIAHLADCTFCRSLVHDVKEAGLGEPTDDEHERIRARVRAHAPTAAPMRSPAGFQIGFQGLALAASLVLVAAVGWYAREQQQRAGDLEGLLGTIRESATRDQQRTAVLEGQLAALQAQAERPGGEPNVPVVDLEPLGARRNADAARRFSVPRAARFVTVILQLDGAGNAGNAGLLTVEIRDAGGAPRSSIDGLRPSDLGMVTVLVPRAAVPDGEAAITLVRTRDGQRVTVGEYRARFDSM